MRYLIKKVIGMLMNKSRISMKFDTVSRIIVVQSLMLSIINYSIRIWGTINATLIQKVQRLQKFAARVSVGSLKKKTTSPQPSEFGWLIIK